VLREKITKKALFFPILTTIIIGFIAVCSNLDNVMTYALHTENGSCEGSIYYLEREVNYAIEWEFTSTRYVDLLIIKKSTLEYFERVALELSTNWHQDYEQLMRDFLKSHYVSRGNYTDSGKTEVSNSGLYCIRFLTSGIINYRIKCDPYSIDLISIFYICLGVATTIGIISYSYKFRKLIKMKPISEIEIIKCDSQIKVSCEKCGTVCDSDSIFCHECGIRLK